MRLILPLLTCLLLVGCWPDDQPAQPPAPKPEAPRAVMPEGLKGDETVRFKYRRDAGLSTSHETVAGRGASIDARGNDTAAAHDASAPTAQLSSGVGGSSGGSLRAQLSAIKPETLMSNPLMWVGLLGIVGAGAALYFGLRRAALFLGIGGAGLIVAAMLPAWAWIVLAAVAVIGGGVYLWAEYGGKRSHEALRAVAAGVSDLEDMAPESYKLVKTRVAKHADAKDAKTIDRVKTEDGL